MKGNLLKKIGAIATTVAMIASVSVTSFANVSYNGADLAGKPIMAEETTTAGIYKVEIPYKSTVANTIGVTMLSYAAAEHAGFENANTPYADTMQIVGVDQINAGDTTNTIGVNGTGTFTFYVDTNGTDAEGTIRMNKGERGIVLLSGDAATSATGYLFQVGKVAATVKVDKGGSTVTAFEATGYPEGTGADYVKGIITTTPYQVLLGGTVATDVTVTAKGADYDAANWQAQTVVYTVSVNDDSYDITPAEITVTYPANTWNATGLKAGAVTIAKDEVTAGLADAVKAAITKVKVMVGEEETEIDVAQGDITVEFTGEFENDATANKEYDVTVKLAAKQYGRVIVGSELSANYKVTVTAQDTREEISSVTFGAANALSIENAVAPEDLAGILAKVKEHVEAGGVKVNGKADYPVASLTYATTDTYTKPTGSDAATVTYTVTAPANVTIAGYKWAADAQATTLTVTVTVKGAAPAYIVGDANQNGVVDPLDWMAIANHLSDYIVDPNLGNPASVHAQAADVNNSGGLDPLDWMAIANHLSDYIKSDTIGQPAK